MITAKEAYTQAKVVWQRNELAEKRTRLERERKETPVQLAVIEQQIVTAVEDGKPAVRFETDWDLTRTAYELLVGLGYRVDTSWVEQMKSYTYEISWYIKEPA